MEGRTMKRTLGIIAALVVVVVLIACRGLWIIHAPIYAVYANPVTWISGIVLLVCILWASVTDSYGSGRGWAILGCLVTGSVWLLWLLISNPLMMTGLYKETQYQRVEQLVPVSNIRPVPYAEAMTNFANQNPEPRYGPGDLDYVRGKWVASFDPSVFFGKFNMPTQGVLVYEPDATDKVRIVRQRFPFAETGLLWNAASNYIFTRRYLVEFHEVIYVEDKESGQMFAVVSLIKRHGFGRVPYVSEIGILYPDGTTEFLSPKQAEKDPRLTGIQIEPEWLAALKVEAYGWSAGVWQGGLYKTGRVDIQRSEINEENSAPYHLETAQGGMWFTPFGPRGKQSMRGIAMEPSGKIGGPVLIWELGKDQAYQGLDAMASVIKAAPGHPAINWIKVSKTDKGTVKSGDTDIIEMIPIPRVEGGQTELYFMGYVAIDPPVKTRFYVIVNPRNQEVLEDVYSAKEVEDWLAGRKNLKVQGVSASSTATVVSPAGASAVDLTKASDAELVEMLKRIADELQRRQKK